MPTSTDVTNLKINELTEAQYDAAVQGGVIGANELSILTDVDDAIQVDTMPAAAAGELGKVYQFIGTTDTNYTHGYFYECVSDGQQPATYSWERIDVQPGSSLPSQTGNAGKFLTTDGTDASWSDKPVINKATGAEALAIGAGTTSATKLAGIAIGQAAVCTGERAIQFGYGTNNEDNTMKVSLGYVDSANYKLLNSDGTIPADRLVHAINKYSTMPTAASSKEGWIVQYTGTTDSTYTHGYIYECVSDGGNPATYSWTTVQVQASSGGLPSQTGQSGKFLTTDGTNASWGYALKNTATGSGSLYINSAYGFTPNSTALNSEGAMGQYSVAIGQGSYTGDNYVGCVAIGKARCTANHAIQIGYTEVSQYTNNGNANTMKVANANGNYEIMSADGTIPTDRFTTTPSADGTYVPTLTISSGVASRSWTAPGGGGSVPTLTWYTVSTAGNTLTIADTSSAQLVKIYKNGLLLQPTDDYTISGTTLTTVAALVVGDKITTEVF